MSRTSIFSLKNKRLSSSLGGLWLIWSIAYGWMVYASGSSLQVSITDSIVSNLLLVFAISLLINILKHYLPGKGNYFNLVALNAAITLLWYGISRTLTILIAGYKDDSLSYFNIAMPVRMFITFLVLSCVSLFIVLKRTEEDKEVQSKRKADAEKLARDAELYRLRQQLQPHFLFNSLNSISSLIGNSPEQARTMIQQLSDFLRSTVRKESEQMIALDDELRNLELYLAIEKVRFGHRLKTTIEAEDDIRKLKIPSLLLQPVVENAIKYGLYDTTGEVEIRIKAERSGNYLQISIQNPFDPETYGANKGTGFGLSSVSRRLQLIFGRPDLLNTEKKETLYITGIKIPQYDQSVNH